MEVVAGGERPGGPFTRRNVQEWSRLDQLTGLLEHARVETDHWTANTSNSSHHFGKVVDSRSRNLADGGQEQRHQTKQLEVFQAHIPGGSLQVIRSSTSSSWQTHKVLSGGSGWSGSDRLALPSSENQDFDHLKLTLNPLDLSSQKTKASVGRSGSIGSRRPPSRPRSIVGIKPEEDSEQVNSSRLTELSSICHKVHEEAKSSQGRHSPFDLLSNSCNGNQNDNITNDTSHMLETKCKIKSNLRNEVKKSTSESTSSNHASLIRKKSCSSEDLHVLDETRNETDSTSSDWRRTSKVRRSLQFPSKQNSTQKDSIIIPVSKSVAEIKRDIEARKQLVTNSFKANQWNNFAELEGVLGVVANGNHDGDQSKDSSNSSEVSAISPTKTSTKKRQTFITVESLKEVRGRLRKLNSPVDEVLKTDDIDDGIDTEVKPTTPLVEEPDDSPKNSVKSYVYGMEVMLRKSKHQITGTGSLESRTSNKSLANGTSRSEEWYNRRKSYGFEQVSNQQSNSSSFEKSKIESSTDSGICRSSDTFASWQKLSEKPTNHISPIKTTHNITIQPYLDSKNKSDIEGDAIVQKGRKTVVNLTSNAIDPTWSWSSKTDADLSSPQDEIRQGIVKGKIADAIRSLREKSSLENQRLSEPITISIPIQQSTKSNSTDPTNLLLKQTKTPSTAEKIDSFNDSSQSTQITPYSELLFGKDVEETSTEKSTFDSIPWQGNRTKALSSFFDSEFKRHSIAVDQAKYLTNKKSFGSYYLNNTIDTANKDRDHMAQSSATKCERDNNISNPESDYELNSHEKKHKKVEFCKTEVHFAAEPGRFNIVETDGKPPPSNMFRRRRKTSSDAPNRSGLPEIRFGDTQYEKNMLSMTENTTSEDEQLANPFTQRSSPICLNSEEDNGLKAAPPNAIVHSRQVSKASIQQKELNKHSVGEPIKSEEDMSKPRSILKNNIPKPKPYILGESHQNLLNEDSSWGVKLKTVRQSEENTKWQTDSSDIKETEFQKLLKSLRPAANKPLDSFEYPPLSEQFSTAADNGLEVRITSSSYLPDHRRASWSVADRVRHVEEAKGYSTKVNFGPQETIVVKADEGVSSFPSSEGIRSSWLIKEQNPSYDARATHELESNFRTGSGRKLAHSQSFNVTQNQVVVNKNKESLDRNVLKSTSLVLEVQHPQLNQTNEFERKISLKDISTNITRDNCEKNVHKVKEASFKKNQSHSVCEKVNNWTQHYPLQSENIKKVHEVNTNTIPPIRKISSATQTYFVNRSSIKKGQPSTTRIKINSSCSRNGCSKSVQESINGIPGVLNALDDLSRCIDEVIIESPQKICKKENSETTQVFEVKEDYKRETESSNYKIKTESSNNVQNVKSIKNSLLNLDLLREIVDSGELSEDSLKADEEVRAYMSTDNDDDTLSSERSGSWSRLRTLKEHARTEEAKDTVSRLSPGSHLSLVPGAEISSEPPRVTSIALHYENAPPPATVIRPTSLYSTTADTKHPVATYVSRNLLNTNLPGISSKVELSNNGDRTWSFSKSRELESVSNKLSGSDQPSALLEKSLNHKISNNLQVRDMSSSPSRYSRNSHSPTKDALFLERTAERSMLYNENNRHASTSPTSGTSKVTSSVNVKLESVQNNSRKNERKSNATKFVSNNISKNGIQNSSTSISKHKSDEKTESFKKGEFKKLTNETKTKERKLSTSSSGRDGWLNTPKEVQMRKKSEPSLRKQEVKKETKTNERVPKTNGVRHSNKRIESPIYQNREIYAERRDSNDNTETESTILEELTKAADQILLAVNGYTDDDSFRASSDDEYRKKREKSINQPLCTISELPTKTTNTYKSNSRQSVGVIKSTRSTDLRKEYHSSSKTKASKTSSNSSMEGGGPAQDAKPLLSSEDRSKRRAARLLQRASSRELLFQSAASSSEDLGSSSDTGSLRTKRTYRRTRLQNGKNSGSKQDLTTSAGESKTKDRVHRTAASEKSQKLKTQSENRCSRHCKVVAGISSGERRERRPQAVVTNHSTRTHKNAKETSQTDVRRRE